MDGVRATPARRRAYLLVSFAAVAALALTASVSRLESRQPSVARGTLWIDSVRLVPMERQVRAPGTLVPERVRLISALTAGRVDSLPIHVGATVEPSTLLLTVTNPDIEMQGLEAEREVAAAKASFASLQTALEQQRLSQREAVAQAETDSSDAQRKAAVLEALDKKSMAGANELQRSRDVARAAETRLRVERERSQMLAAAIDQQLSLQRDQLDRLTAIADFQERTVESLHVMAGERGVVLELPVELGQWVTPGTVLARIARPSRLQAVLRLPEPEVRDVVPGQLVSIAAAGERMPGHVARIAPVAQNGTVAVDVTLEGPLPRGARADLSVDGTIDIERLPNVLSIVRPASTQPGSTITLFKLLPDGHTAVRTTVLLGRSSPGTIEVLHGLERGDKVILSDMSSWGNVSILHID